MIRDSLQVELKNVREDIHRVSLELQERCIRGEKLRQKYEMLSTKNQSIFDDEPKSQAYFLIKAAQEREDLQRYGDDLDRRIRIAEKEVMPRTVQSTRRSVEFLATKCEKPKLLEWNFGYRFVRWRKLCHS